MRYLYLFLAFVFISAFHPVESAIQPVIDSPVYSGEGGGGGGGGSSYLDSVISSVCFDLDATISDSYSGSGTTWANLIASPADGAAQTDYDFVTGDGATSTTYPTFTGTAGDPAAYWNLDGGDYFSSSAFSSMTTLYNMHKSGGSAGQWWVAFGFQQAGEIANAFWGTGWTSADIGLYPYIDPNGAKTLYRPSATSLDSISIRDVAQDWADNDDRILILSADMTQTTNNIRVWVGSTTASTFSKDFGTYTTNNDNSVFTIGASYDEGTIRGILANGARIYHFSAGNEFLDDTKAAAIISHLETRHSRDYTP